MLSHDRAFRISWLSLAFSGCVVLSIPVGLTLAGSGASGWDGLSDEIHFLAYSGGVFVLALLVSLFTGLRSLKRHKIAALWVVPLAVCFMVAIGYGFFGLYIYFFDPYGV